MAWSPSSGTEVHALHTQGVDFAAVCDGARSCSASLEGGPTPGAQVTAGGTVVRLYVPPPVDWFEPTHWWVYGREDPIVGWPDEPLASELVYMRPPRDHVQRRTLRCVARVPDEGGVEQEVVAEYPVIVWWDHSPGRNRAVLEVVHAGGGEVR